ncbi:MAG TPA: hypothetical protein VG122_05770, partial [Gemmata sp.]|nr:hypothetical protein [Gemmata sp.]
MRTTLASLLALATVAALCPAEPPQKSAVPLFEGLGKYTRMVATSKPNAQKYFDQGLMFMFAFNHDEAIRAFRRAAEIDPDCAMAYWGMALASGVNYNNPSFPPEKAKQAFEAVQKAREKSKPESDANRALIEALSRRYADPLPKEPKSLETAYSVAM